MLFRSRSGAMTHVLQAIGWRAARLDGGYKTYRRAVIDDLEALPRRHRWCVVCGLTGSGKSRLLRALAARIAQALDLEALAAHRGSVLGNLPDEPQPSQKMFESLIWSALHNFDPARPVFVEAESKKIGNLRVPQALIDVMWQSACIRLSAPVELRVDMLIDEYQHFVQDAGALGTQLDCLSGHYGHEQIAQWKKAAAAGEWRVLVADLLEKHYDPAYTRSTLKHYPQLDNRPPLVVTAATDAEFARAAAQCIAETPSRSHAR